MHMYIQEGICSLFRDVAAERMVECCVYVLWVCILLSSVCFSFLFVPV